VLQVTREYRESQGIQGETGDQRNRKVKKEIRGTPELLVLQVTREYRGSQGETW